MSNLFFAKPILNSPYEHPRKHLKLNTTGQPTQKIVEVRLQQHRRQHQLHGIRPFDKPKSGRIAMKVFKVS